jgi:hypothetical protein
VNGLANVTTVAPGVVRLAFFSKRTNPSGREECKVVDYQIWSLHELASALQLLNWAMTQMLGAKELPCLVASAGLH